MILLLDVGNSRMKWAVTDGRGLSGLGAVEHRGDPAAAFSTRDWPRVDSVWVANVTGADHEQKLSGSIVARLGIAADYARSEAGRDGLRLAYAEPARLGVDRFLKMLALWSELRSAFCVAGAGTALTFDAVDAGGQHLGGLIAGGLTTIQRAVLGATRFATRPGESTYKGALGRDTESCVREGALHECVGLLDRASQGLGGGRFICGGDSTTLLPHLRGWQHRPNLVLEGLRRYACTK